MKKTAKRLVSMLLCVTMVLGLFPAGFASAAAGDSGTIATMNSAVGSKLADPGNLHGWKQFFGAEYLNTENAGGVWADKSVFTSAEAFKAQMSAGESITGNAAYQSMAVDRDNFLIALSAIAATKEIVGYSAVPTDTVFILDLSQSMDNGGYIPTMVNSTNSAIASLLELNRHNRVSVVLYSGNSSSGNSNLSHATVLLPLDRYTAGNGGKYVDYTGRTNDTTVTVAASVKNSKGSGVSGSKTTSGGTYIQSGLYLAYQEFESAYEDGSTVIASELIQGGTHRIPVIALMSDGLPTVATDQYSSFTRSETVGRYNPQTYYGVTNYGNGTANDNTITFLTQLTAKWLKESVTDWYGNETLFYSLWLKSANDTSANATLQPSQSNATLDAWWKSYLNAADNADVTFRVGNNSSFSIERDDVVDQVSAVNPETEEYTAAWTEAQNYVDETFTATNITNFEAAFEDIVDTIIAQSRYYPTMVLGQDHESSGYITIEDPLGVFMEVKELEGIDIGGHLFTGSALIQMMIDSDFGDREHYTENGWKLIESIQERIGVSEAVAIALAEDAWEYGQLGYDSATGKYSNYIGWYADANNNYLGFWHEGHKANDAPAGATQIMKSYGFYGVVDASISDSNIEGNDMMHIAVRIATQIDDGEQVVTFGIPAALIPLVVYNVEVNSNSVESATEASLSVSGATHPIRLLMEVGLRDDINELTVDSIVKGSDHYHTDADGNYVFYTNRWGDMSVSGGMVNPPHFTDHTATISHYNPSVMNERYYYHQDSVIYTDQNGTRYTGTTAPTGSGYYHVVYVFVATGVGDEAEIRKIYLPITTHAIAHAEKDADGDGWHIPGSTARYDIVGYHFPKTENTTDTLPYIVDTEIPGYDQGQYEVYEMHGNNGRITLGQATGLELTKQIAVVVPGTSSEDFVLNVDFAAPIGVSLPATVKVSYDQLTYVEMDIDDVKVTLDANQKVWIYGLPGGATYTVTEEAHADYLPETATVSGTLVAGSIVSATFRNVAKEAGRVVITKKVVHPFDNETVPSTITFDFIAKIVDKNGDPVANATIETSGGAMTSNGSGEIMFKLGDGESLSINELDEDTVVQVSETNLPAGFTSSPASAQETAEDGTVKEILFTNTYAPAAVKGDNVEIVGTKLLDGRLWQDFDSYRFRLQYWNGISWQTLAGGAGDTATKADPTFNLSDVIADFEFTHEGNYRFWIVEEEGTLGGVTYDSTVREFVVTVEDNWNGAYEISSVTASDSRVTVTSNTLNGETTYTVQTSFTNRYGARNTFVDLSGSKTLSGDKLENYVGESGFRFDLYTASADPNGTLTQGSLIYSSYLKEDGKFIFDHNYIGHLVFDQVGTYYFIVREAVTGSDPLMVFDETYYEVKVVVTDNQVGNLVAETTVTRVEADGARSVVASNGLFFENTRKPEPISATIPGVKSYNLTLTQGMFTFDLYKATLSGTAYTPSGSAILSAQNAADGSFLFADSANATPVLEFAQAGDYHFAVMERVPNGVSASAPTAGGITYDTKVYGVTIRVTETIDANGRSTLSYTTLVNGNASGSIRFENIYDASATTDVVIRGEKTLDGQTAGTDSFSFELCHATVSGGQIQIGSSIEVKAAVNGAFAFTPIRYTSLADVGTHYYAVREMIPAAADSNNTLNGITYDARVYLVTVTVSDNGDGTLKVVSEITLNGAAAELKFENTYSITSQANTVISGEKIARNFTLADGDFTFDLYEASLSGTTVALGNKLQTKSTVGGVFTFDPLTYDSVSDVGDHYYVVKESLPVGGVLNGIAYDSSEYLVKVTVTDNGDGTLNVVKTVTKNGVASEIEFENVYGITAPNGVTIQGEKTLSGQTLVNGTFTFELYNANLDGQGKVVTVGSPIDSHTNLNGAFTFHTIHYDSLDDVGTHLYAVKEVIPQGANADGVHNGVLYDARVYLVTVTVSDNGDGTLSVTSSVSVDGTAAASIAFENKYGVMTPATITLGGEKTMDGKAAKDGAFTFALYKAISTANGLEIVGDPISTKSTVDGKFTFDELRFTSLADAGTYYYAIKEVIPAGVDANYTLDGIVYDPTVYYVQVIVKDNGDGTFLVSSQYATEDAPCEKAVFANKTAEVKVPPQTSDRTNLVLWYALLFVSGAALFVIPLRAKKRRG